MTHREFICRAALVALIVTAVSSADAQYVVQPNIADQVVNDATAVFAQAMVMPQNEIPRSLLAEAQAIAIMPGMIRGAFVVGVQHGRGVLVPRDAMGNWQTPRMIQITGGSIGYQIGVQATDLVLVFRTPQSVANVLRGTVKIGVDASAAAGPVGRQTSAATDIQLQAEILSYSRARGAFVGVSIDGSSISLDPAAEAMYYGVQPGVFPSSAYNLLQVLTSYSGFPLPVVAAPAGTVTTATSSTTSNNGWVPQGQRPSSETEATRRQLETASKQLAATLDENWKQYLALPPEIYIPNQVPSAEAMRQSLARYEEVARQSQYAALQTRPEFQQALRSLRQLGDVRTASNSSLNLPPPPK
jgi:lipid-binding SYLF domain-containing protein